MAERPQETVYVNADSIQSPLETWRDIFPLHQTFKTIQITPVTKNYTKTNKHGHFLNKTLHTRKLQY